MSEPFELPGEQGLSTGKVMAVGLGTGLPLLAMLGGAGYMVRRLKKKNARLMDQQPKPVDTTAPPGAESVPMA